MGKATMAKCIEIFFRSSKPTAAEDVLKKATDTLSRYEGTLTLKMERPFLKCTVVGDEETAEKAVREIISVITPLVTFVNRQ